MTDNQTCFIFVLSFTQKVNDMKNVQFINETQDSLTINEKNAIIEASGASEGQTVEVAQEGERFATVKVDGIDTGIRFDTANGVFA